MKKICPETSLNTITVISVLSADCLDDTTTIKFSDYISKEPSYVKSTYKSYRNNGISVVTGKVEGCFGSERFNTYEELLSILDRYLDHSLSL